MNNIDEITKVVLQEAKYCSSVKDIKKRLVTPLLEYLGWNTSETSEVKNKYRAGIGEKGDEQVDFALVKHDEVVVLIQCVCKGEPVDKCDKQLFDHYAVTPAAVGIITDGIKYGIYTGNYKTCIMGTIPVYEFDIRKISGSDMEILGLLEKSSFECAEVKHKLIVNRLAKRIYNMLNCLITNPDDKHLVILQSLFEKYFNDNEKITKSLFKQAYWSMISNEVVDETSDKQVEAVEVGVPVDLFGTGQDDEENDISIAKIIEVPNEIVKPNSTLRSYRKQNNWRRTVMNLPSTEEHTTVECCCGDYKAIALLEKDLSMTLKAGAYVNYTNNNSVCKDYLKMCDSNGKVLEDISFRNASDAASFVLGNFSSNGYDIWKLAGSNTTLSDWFKSRALYNNIKMT